MQEIALTVDAVIFYKEGKLLQVLLIQRKNPPFRGKWALPGGFVESKESLEHAAIRELKEETGVQLEKMEQVYAFGAPRDPRQRVVSIAHYAVIEHRPHVKGATDATEAGWHDVNKLPDLAFDHADILRKALQILRRQSG